MAKISFIKYDVTIDQFDPASHIDSIMLREQMTAAPVFSYVEMTDGNVTFVDDFRASSSQRRLRIEPAIGDEFNTDNVISILRSLRSFRGDIGWVKGRIANQLHAGIVFKIEGDTLSKVGQTFVGMRQPQSK